VASELRLAATQAALKTELGTAQVASELRLAAAQAALKNDMNLYAEKNNYRQVAMLLGAVVVGSTFGITVASFFGYTFTINASAGK